jgi:hypothetical protein
VYIDYGKFLDETEDEKFNLEKCENRYEQQEEVDSELCLFRHEDNITVGYDQIYDLPMVVPSSPVVDSQDIFDSPIYDDYEDVFPEQPVVGLISENDYFHRINDNSQPSYHNFTAANEVNNDHVEGNSLPLCFSSFELLKGGFNITDQAQRTGFMQNHIGFLELNEDYIWLQRCFQDSNTENQLFSPWDDERKVKYGHSNLVSNFSFSEIFEETGDNQSSESLCLRTLDSELVYDEYTSQSENVEEECNVLDTYECEVTCHSPISFDNMNS